MAWRGINPQTPGWKPAILSTRLQSSANKNQTFYLYLRGDAKKTGLSILFYDGSCLWGYFLDYIDLASQFWTLRMSSYGWFYRFSSAAKRICIICKNARILFLKILNCLQKMIFSWIHFYDKIMPPEGYLFDYIDLFYQFGILRSSTFC